MGLKKWAFKNGPGSPGGLTRGICKSYIEVKKYYPNFNHKVYFTSVINMHFRGILPPGDSQFAHTLTKVGPRFNDVPLNFFEKLIDYTEGEFFPFVVMYVMLYNRNSLKQFHEEREIILNVLLEEYQKLISKDTSFDKYYGSIASIYNYIILTFLGPDPYYLLRQ